MPSTSITSYNMLDTEGHVEGNIFKKIWKDALREIS